MNFETLLRECLNKKGKPVRVESYSNDWLVQVIVENKRWTSVYFTNPPKGIPKFQARDKAEALELAWQLAYADTRAWVDSEVVDSDTHEQARA